MGSTLASYLTEYDSDCVAQFYIKDMQPDIPVCDNYYRVTDSDVLNKVLHPFLRKNVGNQVDLISVDGIARLAVKDKKSGSIKSRAFRMILRNIIWILSDFQKKGFNKWVEDFSPDVVLVQPGDFSFLIKLALKISKKLNIPLIVHQSESYYLKPYFSKSLDYLLFRWQFKKTFEKMMKRASFCIYLCDALENDYKKYFDIPSATIYKSTDIIPEPQSHTVPEQGFRCIYGGNLGKAVGRVEPLVQLGMAVKKCGGIIDVYTSSSGDHLALLNKENGIVLHPAISNDELVEKTKKSDFVIHIENRSKEHILDLKYAFSTKIADMLACGRPSIIYGSAEIAGIRYFAENNLGLIIETSEELYPKIKEFISDTRRQNECIKRACEFAKLNHNPIINSQKTKDIILSVCRNKV